VILTSRESCIQITFLYTQATMTHCQPGWFCLPDMEPMPCPENTFSLGNQDFCTSCPEGKGNNGTANTSCELCPKGTFSDQIGEGCKTCPARFACPTTGTKQPIPCPSDQTGLSTCPSNSQVSEPSLLVGIIAGIIMVIMLCCFVHACFRKITPSPQHQVNPQAGVSVPINDA